MFSVRVGGWRDGGESRLYVRGGGFQKETHDQQTSFDEFRVSRRFVLRGVLRFSGEMLFRGALMPALGRGGGGRLVAGTVFGACISREESLRRGRLRLGFYTGRRVNISLTGTCFQLPVDTL